MRALGYVKDPPSAKDVDFSTLALAARKMPESASLRDFVVEVLDQGQLGSCHDDQTEVLTDHGWRLFAALDGSERLATVDPGTSELTYERPTAIVRFPFEGELVCAESESLNFRVTPDHKMLLRRWNQKSTTLADHYEFVPASEIGWYAGLMNRVVWNGEATCESFTLPGVDHKHKPQRSPRNVPMASWLRFLGIYLAEGTMLKSTNRVEYKIQIAAVKEREKAFVRETLCAIGVNALELADRFTFQSRQIFEAMASMGLLGVKAGDKFVPRFVFAQSACMIREFLAGHFAGDGSEQHGVRSHYTSSVKLADDLQTLAFLSGVESRVSVRAARSSVTADGRSIIGRLPQHRVSICERKNMSIERKKQVFRTPYSGEVFCAEVPTHHTLVTRREGKILVSGNCTCNAAMQAIRINQVRHSGGHGSPPPLGSRLFAYYLARAEDGTIQEDAGTFLRNVFDVTRKLGFCPESAWPYSDDDGPHAPFRKQPSAEAMREAFDQRAKRTTVYRRIASSGQARFDAIKRAICAGFAVTFGIEVDEAFCNDEYSGSVVPLMTRNIAGGHALLMTGYEPHSFEVVNSWGPRWGEDGYFRASEELIDAADDLWAVESVPLFSSEVTS